MNPNGDWYSNEPNPGPEMTAITQYSAKELYNLVEKSFQYFRDGVARDAGNIEKVFVEEKRTTKKLFRKTQQDYSTYARFKAELGLTPRGKYGIGFYKDIFMKTVALEQIMSDEAYTYEEPRDGWNALSLIVKALAETPMNRMYLDMTQQAFTFAQSPTYVDMDGQIVDNTTGDGRSLANAAHLLAHVPATYTNIGPAVLFSKSALKIDERIARNNTLDNFGKRTIVRMTHIWYTGDSENKEEILQFIKSTTDNTQQNPEVKNTYYGLYQPLELQLIDTDVQGDPDATKSNFWGIIGLSGSFVDGNRFSGIIGMWERPRLKPFPTGTNNAYDFSRDALKWAARARYGIGFLDGQHVVYNFAPNNA